MLQRHLHQSLRERALASHREIADLARPLDPEQLVRRPPAGGWSVGEVLEHLCVAEEAYEPLVQELLRRARPDAGAPLREWRPSFVGGFLTRSLQRPRRLPAPKKIRPGSTPRGGVIEKFLTKQSALIARLDAASSFDWAALKLNSPLVPSFVRPLARMNLGDVFSVSVVHVERHTRQIERVIAATR
ncbi:MAG: DinB family protein [bacterium]